MSPSSYRVATWNLWGRLGDDPESRQPAIREVLRELAPDVIGLQEICADESHDDAAELAADLGMEHVWVRASPGTPSGNAILSRWPIVASDSWTLPADSEQSEGSRERRLLFALVETPWGRLPFFDTHLTYYWGASANRCNQVRTVAAIVAEYAGEALPPVVVGDLNAHPDSDEVRLLEGALTDGAGLPLTDVWRWSDDPLGGQTWHPRNPYVAATGEPLGRLDYVMVGLPHADGAGRVLGVRRYGDTPASTGIWPSDHAGVAADLAAPEV